MDKGPIDGASPDGDRAVVNGAASVWLPTGIGEYEVSDQGEIRRGARILAQAVRKGYSRVCLSVGNKKQYREVHGLVAAAFLGPKPEGMQAAHGDGDRSNNRLSNLSYKTRSANEADKVEHGTSQHGDRNHSAKLRQNDIPTIRARLARGERYREIATQYGVSPDAIRKINAGRSWTHV